MAKKKPVPPKKPPTTTPAAKKKTPPKKPGTTTPAARKKAPAKKRKATPRVVKPPALTPDAIREIVRETIAELGLSPVPQRGSNGLTLSPPAPLSAPLLEGLRGLAALGEIAPSPPAPPIIAETAKAVAVAGRTLFPTAPGLERAMCLLRCDYDGGTWNGTGVMLDPQTVLTVGHNIFNKFDNATPRKIQRVTITPGAHTAYELDPVAADASLCHVPPQWEAFASDPEYQNDWRDPSPHDYGVIHFPTLPSWGTFPCIGWNIVDEVNFPASWFAKTDVYLFGYPISNPGGAYPSPPGRAVPWQGTYLKYNMIAEKGQSGGPVFFFYETQDGKMWAFLLAVQSMTFDTVPRYSLGIRMTKSVVDDIDRWTKP